MVFLVNLMNNTFYLLYATSGVEAGKKAAGEVLALQKRVLSVLNEARYASNANIYDHFILYNTRSYKYVIVGPTL